MQAAIKADGERRAAAAKAKAEPAKQKALKAKVKAKRKRMEVAPQERPTVEELKAKIRAAAGWEDRAEAQDHR